MDKLVIVGATSAIAEATAREFARHGAAIYLVGRREPQLGAIAQDLRVRGAADTGYMMMDANDLGAHEGMLATAAEFLGGIDAVLVAHGTLSDQKACEQSVELTLREFNSNSLSVIALCTLVAQRFEQQGSGTLAVISSVAGDRGRASNYVYGSAKAAVTAFLSGLRQRLAPRGISVITIKPGFVDTPMTAGITKGGPLWATPAQVGGLIHRAMMAKQSWLPWGAPAVYAPWFWWGIMMIIKNIPERIFMKLKGL